MIKLYNTQTNIASHLANFFEKVANLTKPQLKIIPYIILGMIESESVVTTDIVKKLKGNFCLVSPFSTVRRLERFFNNERFDIYEFYDEIITYIISEYNPKNKEVHICIDHMYCKDNFTILFFSLKIDKQGIPLWFRCFKGKHDPEAYKTDLIKEGIQYVHNLFKDKDCELIYLADRWFQNYKLMKYMDEIKVTYCIRIKSNLTFYIYNYGDIAGNTKGVKAKENEEQYFDRVIITGHRYKTQLAVSKTEGHKEAIYVLTNGKVEDGIKNYSYRFGSIEFVFKNQKSNGFYLESTKMKNLQAFKTLFGIMCIALLWLTILGVDYSNNIENTENNVKIRCYKKDKRERLISLFNTGLLYFNLCFNSYRTPKIKCNFILCEI